MCQVPQIFAGTRGEVIYPNNLMTFTQKTIGKVRAKETGCAGDNHTHNQEYMLKGPEPAAHHNDNYKAKIGTSHDPEVFGSDEKP